MTHSSLKANERYWILVFTWTRARLSRNQSTISSIVFLSNWRQQNRSIEQHFFSGHVWIDRWDSPSTYTHVTPWGSKKWKTRCKTVKRCAEQIPSNISRIDASSSRRPVVDSSNHPPSNRICVMILSGLSIFKLIPASFLNWLGGFTIIMATVEERRPIIIFVFFFHWEGLYKFTKISTKKYHGWLLVYYTCMYIILYYFFFVMLVIVFSIVERTSFLIIWLI